MTCRSIGPGGWECDEAAGHAGPHRVTMIGAVAPLAQWDGFPGEWQVRTVLHDGRTLAAASADSEAQCRELVEAIRQTIASHRARAAVEYGRVGADCRYQRVGASSRRSA